MQDVRPQLPGGVDPSLKRVPGMSIDFADYQEQVQAFFDAADHVAASADSTGADFEALARLSAELDGHNQAYRAWCEKQIRVQKSAIGARVWLVLAFVLVFSIAVGWLLQIYKHHLRARTGQESEACCIIRGPA